MICEMKLKLPNRYFAILFWKQTNKKVMRKIYKNKNIIYSIAKRDEKKKDKIKKGITLNEHKSSTI